MGRCHRLLHPNVCPPPAAFGGEASRLHPPTPLSDAQLLGRARGIGKPPLCSPCRASVAGPPGQNVTMDEGGTPLLPDCLVYQIFLSLGPADVLAAGLVCRQWLAVSRDEFLWREQFYRYYRVARDVPRHPGQPSCMQPRVPQAGWVWGRQGRPTRSGDARRLGKPAGGHPTTDRLLPTFPHT